MVESHPAMRPDRTTYGPESPSLLIRMARQARHDLSQSWWTFVFVPMILTVFASPGSSTSADIKELLARLTYNAAVSTCVGLAAVGTHAVLVPVQEHYAACSHDSPRYKAVFQILFLLITIVAGIESFLLLSTQLDVELQDAELRPTLYRFGFVCMIILTIVFSSAASYRRRIAREESRAQLAELTALQAKLAALQARLNPHFLFNALNTIAGLVEEKNPAAAEAVDRLATLLRYSLAASSAVSVRLSDELAATIDYLELQKLRFGDRLRYQLSISPEISACELLPLLLQPLVENAVVHGVETSAQPSDIRIGARLQNNAVVIDIYNSYTTAHATRGANSSHRNLRERLELRYGAGANLLVQRPSDGGYLVQLTIPFSSEQARELPQRAV